eukprot:TRINITY_DN244_c0_g1_i5.p1 TRINITY_DN244_c0_g1~~TRINITY_DN244_c0_g1_i5.p1  ORF type:complete len:289 (-),score=12.33 TRINITY_DN244_c0_g1_i5:166-1032(-)
MVYTLQLPSILHPTSSLTWHLMEHGQDFEELKRILNCFPKMDVLCSTSEGPGHMKAVLDAAHPYAFALLSWVISSSRCHIVKLQDSQHIREMKTRHQFLLASASPEKEQLFQELKAEHGSFFAFHGSPIANWHSIMRTGYMPLPLVPSLLRIAQDVHGVLTLLIQHRLRNASGTKLQLHGAAHGAGIYLANNASTSFGYCRGTGKSAKASDDPYISDPENCVCLALCEVIPKGKYHNSGGIYVMPDETLVTTRFFFVYENQQSVNANASSEAFVASVKAAMDAYQALQ